MKYFIERPATWSPANKKCKELLDFVGQFRNTLITDDISRDALVEDIRHKVEALNQAYPRTRRLVVRFDRRDNYVFCQPEIHRIEDEYVFIIRFIPVENTYISGKLFLEIPLQGTTAGYPPKLGTR